MTEARKQPQLGASKFNGAEGGGNSRSSPWLIEQNQYAEGYNIDIDKVGQWSRGTGDTPVGGIEDDPPGGLFPFRDNASDTQYAWAVFGSQLYRSDGDALWEPKACGASFVSDRLHMAVEGNWSAAGGDQRSLYIAQTQPSSGATLATGITAIRGLNALEFSQSFSLSPLAITYFQNRLWAANDQVFGDGNDLAWSELDDGLTYSPANQLTIEAGFGGKITALVPSRDSSPVLHIFKESAIVVLRPRWGSSGSLIPGLGDELDTINSSVRVLSQGVGCVAARTLVAVPGLPGIDLLFLSRDGVRGMQRANDDTQIGASPPLSYGIPDWIDRINFSEIESACATFHDNAYWLAVPFDGATQNTHVLRFDLETQGWALYEMGARDLTVIPFAKEDRMFFQYTGQTADCSSTGAAAATTYQVYRARNGDARPGGAAVEYQLDTRAFDFGEPAVRKHWDKLSFSADVQAGETHFIGVNYNVDFRGWETAATVAISVPPQSINFGTDPLPWTQADQQFVTRHIDLTDSVPPGYFVQFRFHNNTDYATPTIYSVRLTAEADQDEFRNDDV